MQQISVFIRVWFKRDFLRVYLLVSHAVPVDVFEETFFYYFFHSDAKIRFGGENALEEVSGGLINVSRELYVSLYGLLLYNHGVFYLVEGETTKKLKVRKKFTVGKAHRARCQSSRHPRGSYIRSECQASPREQCIRACRSWWWF